MKTYKVVYSIVDKTGMRVAFFQALNASLARIQAYRDLGGDGVVSVWEVTEV